MAKEITPEIMQLIVDAITTHNGYDIDNIKIYGNVIEYATDEQTEYLTYTFEEIPDWDFKLEYHIEEPYVYVKQRIFKRGDSSEDESETEDIL